MNPLDPQNPLKRVIKYTARPKYEEHMLGIKNA